MKITITLDVPDGTTYQVGDIAALRAEVRAAVGLEPEFVPPFADELIPLPDGAQAIPEDVQPFRGAAHAPVPATLCSVHHVPWKLVPAGTSKRTGKPYSAFLACPERGCDQRPTA